MNTKFFQRGFLLFFLLGFLARADEPLGEESARAEVADVSKAGDGPLRIRVFYESPLGVSERSFDDADLWITNAEGFHSGVTFVESNTVIPLPGPNGEIPPVPCAIAIYKLAAPDDGWSERDNGEYTVMLAGEEIAKNDGSHFALALAGTFKVAIGEKKGTVSAISGGISVETFATPGVPGGDVFELAVATLTVTFPHPVEVNWSELQFTLAGAFCLEVEGSQLGGLVPQVVTSYSHRVELGMLEPGNYQVALKSGNEGLANENFRVGGGGGGGGDLIKGLPSAVEIEIVELPTLGVFPAFSAKVRLTFGQYVDHLEWSEVSRKDGTLASGMTAWIDPRILIFAPMVVEHKIFLGMLEPGNYRYELTSLEGIIGRAPILVSGEPGDLLPPEVTVRGATVTGTGDEPLEFSVEFFDESELMIAGIEAQVLFAMTRQGEMIELERTSLNFTADFSAGAIATYRMVPPGGIWDAEDRGRYRLILSEPELVADRLGNHLIQPLIGYASVEIEPDDPGPSDTTELTIEHDELIGRWTASVRLFVSEDLAARDDWSVEWGEARPTGPAFFLQPRFVHAGSDEEIAWIPPSDPTGAGMWLEHDYDFGPISGGDWWVSLNSNLGHSAKGQFLAGDPARPIEPFDFWNEWAERESNIPDDRRFWEYCVGTDPGDASDDHLGDPKPEMIDDENGSKHLGLRCRIASAAIDARLSFEGSTDMTTWVELGPDEVEEVERIVREDGIEEFVVSLVDDVETTDFRYLRVVAERW